jgi:hypothetical protein
MTAVFPQRGTEMRESTPDESGSYQQVTVRGGAYLRLGSRISPRDACQRRTSVTLTGSLPLVQKSVAGDVMFFISMGFWFYFGQKGSGLGVVGFDLPGDGPDKAGEFARHGRDRHLGLFLAHAGEVAVTVMQSPLGFPSNVGNGFGQTFLALFQVGTDPRHNTILPGGFH